MTEQSSGPLSGVRVLDLSDHSSASGAGMLLADYGADVVKIELPGGDPTRSGSPRIAGSDVSRAFVALNRGKRSMVVDWRTDAGRDLVDRLIGDADVLIAYRSPALPRESWPFHYSRIHDLNSRLIYATVTPFGRKGPYARLPGYEPLVQSLSGVMSASRTLDGEPVHTTYRLGEAAPSMLLAHGIMMALLARERTGEGQHVETSMLQGAVAMQSVQLSWAEDDPTPVAETAQATVNSYPCADGRFINIITIQERQWNRLCEVLGLEHLIGDPNYSSGAARSQRREELYGLLEGLFSTRTSWEWLEALQAAGVPCGPTLGRDELFDDPQVIANGYAASVNYDGIQTIEVVGSPVRYSSSTVRIGSETPNLGQHTDELLGEADLSPEEISRLRSDGVVAR